ncbi:hypothetical protein OIDMADRAFT_15975, partial [Oidiodendron maius Zn]
MGSPAPSDETDPYEPWEPDPQSDKLALCRYADWDRNRAYDEDLPIYIHYSIEWKIAVNNRAITPIDTEQDL